MNSLCEDGFRRFGELIRDCPLERLLAEAESIHPRYTEERIGEAIRYINNIVCMPHCSDEEEDSAEDRRRLMRVEIVDNHFSFRMASVNAQQSSTEEDENTMPPSYLALYSTWPQWMLFQMKIAPEDDTVALTVKYLLKMMTICWDYDFQLSIDGRISIFNAKESLILKGEKWFCDLCKTLLIPSKTGHRRCCTCFDTDFCSSCYAKVLSDPTKHEPNHCFFTISTLENQLVLSRRTAMLRLSLLSVDTSIPSA